jgi:long-subunit acyl-CoA synthetase (AMP-forming)
MLISGQLGVHPPGALGVGFFMHARADSLIGTSSDGITEALSEAGCLLLEEQGEQRMVPLRGRIYANLMEADAKGALPELLLVCCNPNQLAGFTGEVTRFLESLAERDLLGSPRAVREVMPIMLVLPNGVLHESAVNDFREQIEESILMDRLPAVTPETRDAILDRVVRGISLQAGGRRGSGRDTVYLLEGKGAMLFAGSPAYEGERIAAILTERGYSFTHVQGVPATRIEFDKAMISIVLNVGGLIHMVRPDGSCIDLRMGDLCTDPSKAEFVDQVTRAVFDVGRAIGAYPVDTTYDSVWAGHRQTILKHAKHVTSSVKTFRDALERGLDSVRLLSNEEWILTPLQRYAANADMKREEELFRELAHQVQQAMARAIKHGRASAGNGGRSDTMKLTAQRNINVDLYEDGEDRLMLLGTFHDAEHLIRLELTINVPDRQITRSRLSMIRTPFPVCAEVEAVGQRLIGLRIERGVLGEIAERLGGRAGCSHIRELATSIVHFVGTYLIRLRVGVEPFGEAYLREPAEDRFRLTHEFLEDSCLAYSQLTALGLDAQVGIRRIGEEHASPVPIGDHEPSFGALLRDRVARWGDRTYIRYRTGQGQGEITWRDFGDRVMRIARHLIAQDLRPGDHVAVVSENRVEMYLIELAVMAIGAVSVPIFAGYPPPLVGYVIRHARPRVVVVSTLQQLAKIEPDRHPFVEKYFCMDSSDETESWGAIDFATLLEDGGAPTAELEGRMEAVRPDDLCTIMYTSGTTGPPKGVCLCNRNLISQQKAISLIWDVDESDVFISFLPWHHSFGGLFERFMTLYNGCELGLDDSRGRDLDRLVENWERFNPTLFFSVPRVHDQLLTRCRENKALADMVFGNRLRLIFTAGASLPAHVEEVYRSRGVEVREGWGLTETSPCVTVTNPDREWRSGYVGFPIPGVSTRIDSDQEILVRGPNVMQGYLDDEDATSRVIDADGWFHTGDLGEYTSRGLRILGRKDGAFKLTTGEKVHPQRVETTLVNESPYIGTALVLGSGKDYVAALIYPDFSRLRSWADERGFTSTVLTDHPAVRELFAEEIERVNPRIEVKYQRIKRVIIASREPSLERGELTPSSKIVRPRVFDSFKHEIDQLFEPEPSAIVVEVGEGQVAEEVSR